MSRGLREVVEIELGRGRQLLVDDLVAEIDALVADVDARARDQLLHLALRLAAEAAEKLLVAFARPAMISSLYLENRVAPSPLTVVFPGLRCSITLSMMPYSWASCAVMK